MSKCGTDFAHVEDVVLSLSNIGRSCRVKERHANITQVYRRIDRVGKVTLTTIHGLFWLCQTNDIVFIANDQQVRLVGVRCQFSRGQAIIRHTVIVHIHRSKHSRINKASCIVRISSQISRNYFGLMRLEIFRVHHGVQYVLTIQIEQRTIHAMASIGNSGDDAYSHMHAKLVDRQQQRRVCSLNCRFLALGSSMVHHGIARQQRHSRSVAEVFSS